MSNITRRELLEVAAAAALSTTIANQSASKEAPAVKHELYTRCPIEIYTSTLSAAPGETVRLHVSTTAKRFDLRIARVGSTEDVVWTKNDLPGVFYPTPASAWEKGCGWPVSQSLTIPQNWRSGFYEVCAIVVAGQDTSPAKYRAFIVVRAVEPTSKILLVHPTATYGAYNDYGGASLYVKRGNITKGGFIGGERRVSFLRPWMPGFLWKPESHSYRKVLVDGAIEPEASEFDDRGINLKTGIAGWSYVSGFDNWDRVLIHWLEKNDYRVDHAVSSDLELHPELLTRYRLMISVGHDEYWSSGMRDTVESFVARGGNVCFFSGNVAVWQIRHEDGGNTVICYKEAAEEDPLFKAGHKHLTTTLWSSSIVGRAETSLTGLSLFYAGYAGFDGVSPQGVGGYLVQRPDHWVFKDTGVLYADCLGRASNIVHFEVDGCPIRIEQGLPYPASDYEGPSSLEILGLCPAALPQLDVTNWAAAKRLLGDSRAAQAAAHNHGHAIMGLFSHGGTVFCAGTTDWTNGLTGKDPAVEQVTRNLISRLSA